jgi:6-pyruvoyl-tetrahydropterin synthase
MIKSYIKVRTDFEGFHFYPNAGSIDPRIEFLENPHRHMFKVEVEISVTHLDRELEFFLVKWALQDYIKSGNMNHKSCEMIAEDILTQHLIPQYGADRYYRIVVSEDGESDGIIEYTP